MTTTHEREHDVEPRRADSRRERPAQLSMQETIGEYVRLQTELTVATLSQAQWATQRQTRQAALVQRLFSNVTRTMMQAMQPARTRGERAAQETGDTAESADPPQEAENGGGTETPEPVVRRTPDGSLALKRWQPQQLSVEPPTGGQRQPEPRGQTRQTRAQKRQERREQRRQRSREEDHQEQREQRQPSGDQNRPEQTDEPEEGDESDPANLML